MYLINLLHQCMCLSLQCFGFGMLKLQITVLLLKILVASVAHLINFQCTMGCMVKSTLVAQCLIALLAILGGNSMCCINRAVSHSCSFDFFNRHKGNK